MIIITYYSKTKRKKKEITDLLSFKGNFKQLSPAHIQIFTFLNILCTLLHMQDIVDFISYQGSKVWGNYSPV